MSEYLTFQDAKFQDVDCLLGALRSLGYTEIERGAALPLYGYHGDMRPDTAEIVVRRKYIGSLSNDLGFRRQADGSYVPVISAYDTGYLPTKHRGEGWTHGSPLPDFVATLKTAYGEQVARQVAQRLRGRVTRRVEGGKIICEVSY